MLQCVQDIFGFRSFSVYEIATYFDGIFSEHGSCKRGTGPSHSGPTLAAAPLHYSMSLAAAPLHRKPAPQIVFYPVVVSPWIALPSGNPIGLPEVPTLPPVLPYRGTVVPPLPSYGSFIIDLPQPEAQNAGLPAFGHARMSASGSSIPSSLSPGFAPASVPVPATVWLLGSVTLLPLVRRITGRG